MILIFCDYLETFQKKKNFGVKNYLFTHVIDVTSRKVKFPGRELNVTSCEKSTPWSSNSSEQFLSI